MTLHKFRRTITSTNKLLRHTTIASTTPLSIDHNQALSVLLQACPSFRQYWENHVKKRNSKLIYIALGELALHLLKLYKSGETSEFSAVAEAIESLYIYGTPYVKSAITGGLLEIIKINWRYYNVDPAQFYVFLNPISARYWKSIQHH
jgi:hypothetical protein